MDFKNKVEDGICPYKLLKQWVLVYILLVKWLMAPCSTKGLGLSSKSLISSWDNRTRRAIGWGPRYVDLIWSRWIASDFDPPNSKLLREALTASEYSKFSQSLQPPYPQLGFCFTWKCWQTARHLAQIQTICPDIGLRAIGTDWHLSVHVLPIWKPLDHSII
jgi:hypothetical protein